MNQIAKLPINERAELFDIAAARMKIPVGLIEKDFWVCYILDILFHRFIYSKGLVFKGGTCLSKAFGLIDRFSEDVDLVLDWRLLGYTKTEPWEDRSNTAQDKFRKDSVKRTNAFLKNEFAPELITAIAKDTGLEADIYLADEEETILFRYPKKHTLPAILDVIRLEIGPMAAWTPVENVAIQSYLSECIPDIMDTPNAIIRAVSPERTFWEKVSILHQEANRPEEKKMPIRYSRHYYDVYKLARSNVKEKALNDFNLLQKVLAFKIKFYRTPWAKFEEAVPGSIRLTPPEYRISELAKDYDLMQDMLFSDKPEFGEILQHLRLLEKEINSSQIDFSINRE